jgi:hypothetical protein
MLLLARKSAGVSLPGNPNTPKNTFCASLSQAGSASPMRPAMILLSIVAILSKRTEDGALSPVPAVGAIGMASGSLRGTEVI